MFYRGARKVAILAECEQAHAVKIKMVVGEIEELKQINKSESKSGFQTLMGQLEIRLDETSGELDLDDVDLAKLYRYLHGGYREKLLRLFGRTLGTELGGLNR